MYCLNTLIIILLTIIEGLLVFQERKFLISSLGIFFLKRQLLTIQQSLYQPTTPTTPTTPTDFVLFV